MVVKINAKDTKMCAVKRKFKCKNYIEKLENRITFKIKTGYYLERLTPDARKLLRKEINKRP